MSFKAVFRLHIEFEIRSFKEYVEHFERVFEAIRARLQQEWSAHADNQPEVYDANEHDHGLDDLIENNFQRREFLQRFRASMVIQLWSLLETELKRLCEHVSLPEAFHIRKIKRGESDLHTLGQYIVDSTDSNLEELPDFEFLDNLRLLRNNIVHHNGMLRGDKHIQRLLDFAPGNFSVHIPVQYTRTGAASKKSEILFTEDQFLPTVLRTIQAFLGDLLSKMP